MFECMHAGLPDFNEVGDMEFGSGPPPPMFGSGPPPPMFGSGPPPHPDFGSGPHPPMPPFIMHKLHKCLKECAPKA